MLFDLKVNDITVVPILLKDGCEECDPQGEIRTRGSGFDLLTLFNNTVPRSWKDKDDIYRILSKFN